VFTVFHNRASDILRGSKQWWTLASKILRGSGPSKPSQDRRLWTNDRLAKLLIRDSGTRNLDGELGSCVMGLRCYSWSHTQGSWQHIAQTALPVPQCLAGHDRVSPACRRTEGRRLWQICRTQATAAASRSMPNTNSFPPQWITAYTTTQNLFHLSAQQYSQHHKTLYCDKACTKQ